MAERYTTVGVGLMGLGTVGTGVYKLLSRHDWLNVCRIAVRHPNQKREIVDLDTNLLTTDPFEVVRDENVRLVVEVMGGLEPAKDLVLEALRLGKHVVTANKALIATHGELLFQTARDNNACILFEGAVAGGIPIIQPLKLSLAANRVQEIAGILNGTTNYILTRMSQDGWEYDQALAEAQARGFAEADPTNDVDGFDTAYKISILSSIAFQTRVDPAQLSVEGIRSISAKDITLARELGYGIKLIGLARAAQNGAIDARVHPMLVPLDHPLASIHHEYNAVWIQGDAVGDVMFSGKGAGEMPTASAVVADILAIGNDLHTDNPTPVPGMRVQFNGQALLQPVSDTQNRYYIRLNTRDVPGVIGDLGHCCGAAGVSLESVMQKGITLDANGQIKTAAIILITQMVYEHQLQDALNRIRQLETTGSVGCVLRVLG
ncbi:MAG: homoserine dehydrogenase [Candidatus Melainabacteria bacterium]|nr:homoserine dehydrogenase [Candidatus Melainabacteria bacterium]